MGGGMHERITEHDRGVWLSQNNYLEFLEFTGA